MIARCHKTSKRCYWTEGDAYASISRLAEINADRHQPTPIRAYRCPHCGLWHLTKKEARANGNPRT